MPGNRSRTKTQKDSETQKLQLLSSRQYFSRIFRIFVVLVIFNYGILPVCLLVSSSLELTSPTVVFLLYKTEEVEEDDETHVDDTLVRQAGGFPSFNHQRC